MFVSFHWSDGKICTNISAHLASRRNGGTYTCFSSNTRSDYGYSWCFFSLQILPFFEMAQVVSSLIVIIGSCTALFAASVALVQTDIKRIIAYSTCSQLGYMFVAAGAGFYHAAIFHLFTHAFFKALLFLGQDQ